MSKLVDWERWPVAVFFAIQGLATSFSAISGAISMIRDGSGSLFPTYGQAMSSFTLLLCSWGLVKWRHWAYVLALVLAGFGILTVPVTFKYFSLQAINWKFITWTIFDCAALVWLLLPAVRAEYSRRNQIA